MNDCDQPQARRPYNIYVDEVGRGALAFDVVAAAVILPTDESFDGWEGIKDSKKIKSHKKRCELGKFIKENCSAYGIGSVSPMIIDELNILKATMKAMHLAIYNAIESHRDVNAEYKLYIDGNYFKPSYPGITHECIIKGDDKMMGISAASIIAKSHRDSEILKIMENEGDQLKMYGFETNMAYGTAKHFEAIRKYGATSYHRYSFLKNI